MPEIGIIELSIIGILAIILIKPDEWPTFLRKVGYFYGIMHRYLLSAKSQSRKLYEDITNLDNASDDAYTKDAYDPSMDDDAYDPSDDEYDDMDDDMDDEDHAHSDDGSDYDSDDAKEKWKKRFSGTARKRKRF